MNNEPEELKAILAATTGEVKAFILKQTKAHDELTDQMKELKTRTLELEQRGVRNPRSEGSDGGGAGELAELLIKGAEGFIKGSSPSVKMVIPSRLISPRQVKEIVNLGDQALVQSDRGPQYIATAPQRRLTIRALFQSYPTQSDSIERCLESVWTDGTEFQGGASSPTGRGEGAIKGESQATFTLEKTVIPTIAHFIVASRQILSDSRLLQSHLERRLIYFLNLKEEAEFLTGTAQISGINTNAAAFTGGATNATRLDTLARAANQLAVGNYDPSGFLMHPTDWLETSLEKDTTGKYILGDPGAQRMPSAWGLPVVPTPSQTLGTFTVIDAARYGFVADRAEADVRIGEINDQFTRNLLTLLCEKRAALITEMGAAAVTGSIATPG